MFNLNEIIPHFDHINRKYYLGELLWNASISELHKFKKEVKIHQKKSKFIPDSAFKPNGSAHDTIIAAINFNFLKRTTLYNLCNALFPIKKLIFWFAGFSLEKHPYYGVCYKHRNREMLLSIKRFWFAHWKWIIGTIFPIILTMIGLYVAWLTLITPKP